MHGVRLRVDRLSQVAILCLWSSAWGRIPTVKTNSQPEELRLRSVESLVAESDDVIVAKRES
jgi:hypothetical protein